MEILSVFETVKNSVEAVRDKVDYVVVFYHGGFERDLESGNPTENLTGENVGYEICNKISFTCVFFSFLCLCYFCPL